MVKWFKIINLKVFNNNYIKEIIDDCMKQRFIITNPSRHGKQIDIWNNEWWNLILKYRKDLIK